MNETEQNLLTAFRSIIPSTETTVYKVYYDANGLCTITDTVLHDQSYIQVDKETFNTITPCLYCVINNQLQLRKQEFKHARNLIRSDVGQYQTTKGTGMFLVDANYTGPTDSWTLK